MAVGIKSFSQMLSNSPPCFTVYLGRRGGPGLGGGEGEGGLGQVQPHLHKEQGSGGEKAIEEIETI